MLLCIYVLIVVTKLCVGITLEAMHQSPSTPLPLYQTCIKALEKKDFKAALLTKYYIYEHKFRALPNDIREHLIKSKNTLLIATLIHTAHSLQEQTLKNDRQIMLSLAYDKQMLLTLQQTNQLMQKSSYIRNSIGGGVEQASPYYTIDLDMLTHEDQVNTLTAHVQALDIVSDLAAKLNSAQKKIVALRYVSARYLKKAYKHRVVKELQVQSIPDLCALVRAYSYLALPTKYLLKDLAYKLIISKQEYITYKDIITNLPHTIQHILIRQVLKASGLDIALRLHQYTKGRASYSNHTGHTNIVWSLSWSPDSKRLASSSLDGTIKIWDKEHRKCVNQLKGWLNKAVSVSWSPDGNYISSNSNDFQIQLWNTQTQQCRYINNPHIHYNPETLLQWSPNGKYIANGARDRSIRIWDRDTGECIQVLTGHHTGVNSVSWSPDGKYLASGADIGILRIWDSSTGDCLSTLDTHQQNHIFIVSWSPNGKFLATGAHDRTVRIWNVKTSKCYRILQIHTEIIGSLSWAPNSRYLISCSLDNTVSVWDIENNIYKIVRANAISWSPDGKYIAISSTGNNIKIYTLTYDQILLETLALPDIVQSIHAHTNQTDTIKSLLNKIKASQTASSLSLHCFT